MASTAAIQQVAEKYVPEIIAGVTHPIDYRDAIVESDRVVVKSTEEMDPQLSGWLGYAVPVTTITRGKRKGVGVLGKPEPVVVGEPSVNEFLMWAKKQKIRVLTQYLAEQKIKATGDIVFMLAYRLTYCYEQAWHDRRGTWPLEPVKMEIRKRKIETLTKFLNTKGVGNHPDEFAIVQKMFLEEGKPQPNYRTTGEPRVADPEKKSDVLKRLRAQAAETEEKTDEKPKGEKGDKKEKGSAEVDAVKAGKKKGDKVEDKKGKDTKSSTQEPATPASEKESAVSKKSDKKGAKKAAKKEKVAKPAKAVKEAKPKAEKKGNANAKAKDFPLECKVKYIGTRVKHHVGKTGVVVAHKSEKGLAIKWSDGLVATATAGAVERVK